MNKHDICLYLTSDGYTPLMINRRLNALIPELALPNQAELQWAKDQMTLRIASTGDSTAAREHGTWWSSSGEVFYGKSDDSGHAAYDEGTLTIYADGTATWQADGDTVGAAVAAGTGLVWMESGTPGKGFGFVIMPDDVEAASPTGTETTITVAAGSPVGAVGFVTGGAVVWQNVLSGWRTCITGICGIGGTTTANLRERIDNAFYVDSHGKPLLSPPDVIYVSDGINDCTALAAGSPGYTIADVLENLTAIKDAILALGCIPIFASLSHEDPGTAKTYMDQVNAHLAAMAAADDRVYFANYAAEVDDVGGDAKPDYMIGLDYTSSLGAKVCGQVLNELLDTIIGTNQGRAINTSGAANLAPDGDCQGTGGELIEATGVSALDVWCGTGLGVDIVDGCTAVCSKEASFGEDNPWQVVTVTGGVEDSYVIVSDELVDVAPLMQGAAEFYLSDASKVGGGIIGDMRFSYIFYDNMDAPINFLSGISIAVGAAGQLQGVVKTDKITPPAGAVTARIAFIWWQPATNDVVFKARIIDVNDVS